MNWHLMAVYHALMNILTQLHVLRQGCLQLACFVACKLDNLNVLKLQKGWLNFRCCGLQNITGKCSDAETQILIRQSASNKAVIRHTKPLFQIVTYRVLLTESDLACKYCFPHQTSNSAPSLASLTKLLILGNSASRIPTIPAESLNHS